MFAPPITKATRASASSNKELAERSNLVEERIAGSAVEPVHPLQGTFGTWAALRLPSQRAARPEASQPSNPSIPASQPMQVPGGVAAPGLNWDFSNVLLFSPDRANPSQGESSLTVPLPPGILQRRLDVGEVDDPLEREADRVAEHMTRMACPEAATRPPLSGGVPAVQRKCSCGGSCDKCHAEESEQEHPRLQMKPARAGALERSSPQSGVPPIVHGVLRSPGQPLDPAARAFFEPRFGYGFNQVRVHTDTAANQSAGAIGARAYTVGYQIAFGAGRYAPATADGAKLIAHELAHVVQQGEGTIKPTIQRAPEVEVKAEQGATCTLDQHRKIEPAAQKANEWLSRAISGIDALLGGPWSNRPLAAIWAADGLSKHFHSTDPAVVAYVKARLAAIQKDIFGRQNFRVNCPPASDQPCALGTEGEELVARVPNSNEVDFCRPFFERSVEDDASTIIHEFAHALLGLTKKQDIIDRAYKSDWFYSYLTTAEALTNAESYAMFAREVATGSSPAPEAISDDIGDSCPDDWVPLIQDAMRMARMWNHRAALSSSPPAPPEFTSAYITMDTILKSDVSFKCILDRGWRGRCERNLAYWLMGGGLRICQNWRHIPSPDERALALLGALYGYKDQLGDDDKRDRAAKAARDLHAAFVPSTADVLSGKGP